MTKVTFNSQYKPKPQQDQQTSSQKNQCNICNEVILGNTYRLRVHLYNKHGAVKSRFKCPHCSKEYYRRDEYSKHLLAHSESKHTKMRHICDHCDRSFVDKRNLISHLKVHDEMSDVNQYKCMACGVSYCEERLLKYHIRKEHFNLQDKEPSYIEKMVNETWVERVMQTKLCVEMTKVNNNVINIKKCDVKIKTDKNDGGHSKFKNYISSVFATQDQSHYSKAVCDYCKKEMLKKSLLNHIRERHLNWRKFKCDKCKVGFNRHYQLVNHNCGRVRKLKRRQTPMP